MNAPLDCPVNASVRRSAWAKAGLCVWGAALVTGCGGGSDSIDKACSLLAQAQCALRQSCSNAVNQVGVNILASYGDMQTCIARQQMTCANNANAPGTGSSAAQIERCANEVPSWTCTDFFDNGANPPADCAPAGKRSNGQPCAVNGQCASRFCAGIKNASCGVCSDEPVDGASCLTSTCAPGQVCRSEADGSMVCRERRLLGDPTCTSDLPCQSFSSCVGASSTDPTKMGVCTETSATLGPACGATNPACEGNQGLACLGPTGSKTCQQVAYLSEPSACGTLADGSRAECIDGDCFTPTAPAAASDTNAKCVSKVADGSACDTQVGPLCQTPARCVTNAGSTRGVCTVPNPALCD